MNNIKAVLIDIDDTLLDFSKCAEESMRISCAANKLEYTQSLCDTFHEVNDMLWQRIELGSLTPKELHRIRWNLIFEKRGIKADGEAFEADFFRNLSETSVPVDGALDLLKYLSRKYSVYTASNAAHRQQAQRLQKSGMLQYIKDCITSVEIGFQKPTKEFFDVCMQRLGGISKDEIVIIGDSLTADIEGGISYGIKTIWFNKYGKNPLKDINSDFTVTSLSDIKSLL